VLLASPRRNGCRDEGNAFVEWLRNRTRTIDKEKPEMGPEVGSR